MDKQFSHTDNLFYQSTLQELKAKYPCKPAPQFVLVQHAYQNTLSMYEQLDKEDLIGAIILKPAAKKENPELVEKLKERYGDKVHLDVNWKHLQNPQNAISFLKENTDPARPVVIVEYGGYFASAAEEISKDPELKDRVKGIVEGTQNGILKNYGKVVHAVDFPIFSRAKSEIKQIYDQAIGPLIVETADTIFAHDVSEPLYATRKNIGILGLSDVGSGVYKKLKSMNHNPMVYDKNFALMASYAEDHAMTVREDFIYQESDILFCCTGMSYLAKNPHMLEKLKDGVTLVFSTSGDSEMGIPQLVKAGLIRKCDESEQDTGRITKYETMTGKRFNVMLGEDEVGRCPISTSKLGSGSKATLMSNMELIGLGYNLAANSATIEKGKIHESPMELQNMIMENWMQYFGYRDKSHVPIAGAVEKIRSGR